MSQGVYTHAKLKNFLVINWDDYDKLILPINIFRCHWFLFDVNIPQNKTDVIHVDVWDSSPALDSRRYAEYISALQSFMLAEGFKGNIQHKIIQDAPKQKNGDDCGLFVLRFAEQFMGLNPSSLSSLTRRDVAQSVLSGTWLTENRCN
jgi:Ulp1 family protease